MNKKEILEEFESQLFRDGYSQYDSGFISCMDWLSDKLDQIIESVPKEFEPTTPMCSPDETNALASAEDQIKDWKLTFLNKK